MNAKARKLNVYDKCNQDRPFSTLTYTVAMINWCFGSKYYQLRIKVMQFNYKTMSYLVAACPREEQGFSVAVGLIVGQDEL